MDFCRWKIGHSRYKIVGNGRALHEAEHYKRSRTNVGDNYNAKVSQLFRWRIPTIFQQVHYQTVYQFLHENLNCVLLQYRLDIVKFSVRVDVISTVHRITLRNIKSDILSILNIDIAPTSIIWLYKSGFVNRARRIRQVQIYDGCFAQVWFALFLWISHLIYTVCFKKFTLALNSFFITLLF